MRGICFSSERIFAQTYYISERVPCACITAHRVLLLRELFPYLPASSQPDDVLTTVCRTYYFVAGEIVRVGRE